MPILQGVGYGRGMAFNASCNNISLYIVEVSFIGGGNRSTWRKPPACHKSMTNFMLYRVHLAMRGIQAHNCCGDKPVLVAQTVANPTTIQSRPRRPLFYIYISH
jgi:hypothetical protein